MKTVSHLSLLALVSFSQLFSFSVFGYPAVLFNPTNGAIIAPTNLYIPSLTVGSSNVAYALLASSASNLIGTLPVSQLPVRAVSRNTIIVTNGNYTAYFPAPNIKLTSIVFTNVVGALGWVAEIDLTNNTTIAITPPNPTAAPGMTNDVLKNTVLNFMQANHAFLALDLPLFNYVSASPYAECVGFAASGGAIVAPFTTQPPIDGAGPYPNQSYAIVGNSPAINLDPANHGSLVTRGASGMAIAQTNVTIWNAFSGSALILTNGVACIPTYTTGLTTNLTYNDNYSWYNVPLPRGFAAINQAGTKLYLGVLDSTNGNYLTVSNVVALVLLDHVNLFPIAGDQPWFALNTDGGSSPTFCVQNPISNSPMILNPTGQTVQRNDALAIAVGYQGTAATAVPDSLLPLAQSGAFNGGNITNLNPAALSGNANGANVTNFNLVNPTFWGPTYQPGFVSWIGFGEAPGYDPSGVSQGVWEMQIQQSGNHLSDLLQITDNASGTWGFSFYPYGNTIGYAPGLYGNSAYYGFYGKFTGILGGNGAAVTNLNAAALTGSVPASSLPPIQAFLPIDYNGPYDPPTGLLPIVGTTYVGYGKQLGQAQSAGAYWTIQNWPQFQWSGLTNQLFSVHIWVPTNSTIAWMANVRYFTNGLGGPGMGVQDKVFATGVTSCPIGTNDYWITATNNWPMSTMTNVQGALFYLGTQAAKQQLLDHPGE